MRKDSEMVSLRSVIETLCYMVDDDSDGVEEIMQLPTIDLVRCKDCMWWINNLTEFSADEDFLQCRWNEEESPNADDYCSYGERKESE